MTLKYSEKGYPDEVLRNAARRNYANPSNDDIEIDDDAKISRCDEGAWIQAWVWVPFPRRIEP